MRNIIQLNSIHFPLVKFNIFLIPFIFFIVCHAGASDRKELTFELAYQGILEKNSKIQIQNFEIEASEFKKIKQMSSFYPQVDLTYSDSTSGESPYSRMQSAALTAKANVFRSFSDINGVRAAERSIEGHRETLLVEKQSAEEEALKVLTTFIARTQQREISEKTVKLKTESFRIANERFKKGLLPMQEVAKVGIDLENARSALVDAIGIESDARVKLTVALGSETVSAIWPWKVVLSSRTADQFFRPEFNLRHDWRAAQAFASAEKLKTKQVLGTLLPSINFSASYGTNDLANRDRKDWQALWTLSVPIFSGFQDYANYKTQFVFEQQTELKLEQLKKQIVNESGELKTNHLRARESALAREKTAKLTEQLYSDNLKRFQMGRANANDLELDLNRLLQAQVLEIEGWLAVHLSWSKLCHGYGGFMSGTGECDLRR